MGNFAYECNNFGHDGSRRDHASARPNISAPLGDANGAEASASIHGVDCTAADRATIAEAHRSQSELDDSQRAIRLSELGALPVTVLLITGGGAERVSLLLSVVVAWMVVCFAAALSGTGAPPGLLFGLVPTIPAGAAEVALAVMGTTAIPLNLLLGSSLARTSSLESMRQGVGLASLLSGLISVLVQLIGASVPSRPPCVPFELRTSRCCSTD